MKLCPHCNKEINDLAITCRHCLRMITDRRISSTPVEEPWENSGDGVKMDTNALQNELPIAGVSSTVVSSEARQTPAKKSYTWIIVMAIIMKIGGYVWTQVIVPELQARKGSLNSTSHYDPSGRIVRRSKEQDKEMIGAMLYFEDQYMQRVSALGQIELGAIHYNTPEKINAALDSLRQYQRFNNEYIQELNDYSESAGYGKIRESWAQYTIENKLWKTKLYMDTANMYAKALAELYVFILTHQKDAHFEPQMNKWIFHDTTSLADYQILSDTLRLARSALNDAVINNQSYNVQFLSAQKTVLQE